MPAEGMLKRISFEEIVPEKTFDLNCHRSLGTIRQMDLPGECMRDLLGKRNKPDETKDLQEDQSSFEKMGISFVEYLTQKRMEKAKYLLRNTAKRSGEIAYEVGYKDPRYFSFVFKKTQFKTSQSS